MQRQKIRSGGLPTTMNIGGYDSELSSYEKGTTISNFFDRYNYKTVMLVTTAVSLLLFIFLNPSQSFKREKYTVKYTPIVQEIVKSTSQVVLGKSESYAPVIPNDVREEVVKSASQVVGEIQSQDSIQLTNEGGQFYMIYDGLKHSLASPDFSYFGLKLTDVISAIPETSINRLPEGSPFFEMDDEEKEKLKTKFLNENRHGLHQVSLVKDVDYEHTR